MSGVWSQNVSVGMSPKILHLEALKDCNDLAPLNVSLLRVSSLPTETSIADRYSLSSKVPAGNSVKNW